MTAFASLDNYQVVFPETATDQATRSKTVAELNSVCGSIRVHCGQTFDFVEGDVITVHGTGRRTLLLPQLPVAAVNAVTIDKDLDTESVVTDFQVDGETGTLYRTCGWPAGFLNITVDYDHGYEEDAFPPDLIDVAVRFAHDKIVSGPSKLTSETIAGYAYGKAAGAVTIDDYADALEPYRIRRVPVA